MPRALQSRAELANAETARRLANSFAHNGMSEAEWLAFLSDPRPVDERTVKAAYQWFGGNA